MTEALWLSDGETLALWLIEADRDGEALFENE